MVYSLQTLSLCDVYTPQPVFIPLSRKRRLPYLRGAHPPMLPLQKIANCQKNSDTRTQGHNFEGVIKGMSSSKIEEVGEARRSMNAVCGVMV